MKTFAIASFLLYGSAAIAQQSAVKGVVSIHNSETRTGKRQYVSNAEIEDDFGKATPRLTDGEGRFMLMYVGVQDKASVSFQVKKKGLQVVDQTALNAVAGQDGLVKISMAYPDSINEYRRQIFQVGKTEAEKRLETLVESNAKELAALRKNDAKNEGRIKAVEAELARLGEQSKRITEEAEALARKYAPLNLDDAPRLFRTAFSLFQKGLFDSAYQLLQQANLDGRVDAIVAEKKKLTNLRQELVKRDAAVVTNTDDARQALELKADFHKTKYEYDSAGHCYQQLIRLDSTNGKYLLEYANFFDLERQYDSALLYAGKALTAYRRPGKTGKEEKEAGVAHTLSRIGSIQSKTNHFADAEAVYQEALTAARKLKNNEAFMASLYHSLGTLYSNKKEFAKAETAYQEALKIRTKLAKKDSATYKPQVAYTQAGLGILYRFKGDFTNAETAYTGLVKVYQQLAKENTALYEPLLATMYEQSGLCYLATNSFADAERVFLEAVRIRRKEVAANPQIYMADMASALAQAGELYSEVNDFGKSELFLSEALLIYRQLLRTNPQVYRFMTAVAYRKLAILYSKKQDVAKAAPAFDSALVIYRQLVREYPHAYEPELSLTLYNQGVFARTFGNLAKAKTALSESLDISTRLDKVDVKSQLPRVALGQASLGDTYTAMANYEQAKKLLESSIKTYEQLVKIEPKAYNPLIANVRSKLAGVYQLSGDTARAVSMYLSSLASYEPLVAASPQAYEQEQINTKAALGNLYSEKREYAKAEDLLKQALDATEKRLMLLPAYGGRYVVIASYLAAAYANMPPAPQVQGSEKALNDKLNGLAKSKKITPRELAIYFNDAAWYLCLAGRFTPAETYARKGMATDPTLILLKVNLAHSLLFQGKTSEASKLYKEMRETKKQSGGTYGEDCLSDLDVLEKKGFASKDVATIRGVLKP